MSLSITFPRFKAFVAGTNQPLAGGTVECYLGGTTTPQIVYSDGLLSVSLGSIVTLDANGEALMFPAPNTTYKFLVKDSGGNLQSTTDYWSASGSGASAPLSGNNLLLNGSFEIAQPQPALPGNLVGAATQFLNVDGFATRMVGGTPANFTWSRVASGRNGSQYALRLQRNAGASDTTVINLVQNIETLDTIQTQGNNLVLSFWFRAGVGSTFQFSTINVFGGTGTDESWQTAGSLTGQQQIIGNVPVPLTTAWQQGIFNNGVIVPSTMTELSVVIVGSFSGTAGGTDYVDFDDMQLELGLTPTAYQRETIDTTLRRCQRRYYKSFALNQAPASNIGGAGGMRFLQCVGASTAGESGSLFVPAWMRNVVPIALPTFNLWQANSQARNMTIAADCTLTTGQLTDVSNTATEITFTTPAASAVGNIIQVGYVVDKRF